MTFYCGTPDETSDRGDIELRILTNYFLLEKYGLSQDRSGFPIPNDLRVL